MMERFADTSYFIALVSERDQYYARALDATREWRGPLVTTRWVITEWANAAAGSDTRRLVAGWYHAATGNPLITIFSDDNELFERGMTLYAQRSDKDWSLTDCISFVVMRERGITDALTADRHFEQAGFVAPLR